MKDKARIAQLETEVIQLRNLISAEFNAKEEALRELAKLRELVNYERMLVRTETT